MKDFRLQESEGNRTRDNGIVDEARKIVRSTTLPSVSFVQRKLHIDFEVASWIMKELEDEELHDVPKLK